MSTVIMRHPSLPRDQEIEVEETAQAHYAQAGWQVVPAEELEAREAKRLAAVQAVLDAEYGPAPDAQAPAETAESADVPAEEPPKKRATRKPAE